MNATIGSGAIFKTTFFFKFRTGFVCQVFFYFAGMKPHFKENNVKVETNLGGNMCKIMVFVSLLLVYVI